LFLRREKGVKTIYLLGYSMGGRMSTAFLANDPDSKVAGYIGVGTRNGNGTGGVLDSLANLLKAPVLPILDVWGTGGDGKDAKHAAKRARLGERGPYSTAVIEGAPHSYKGYEKQMNDAVIAWLKSRG
jgi:dienelactone hydrolase